MANFTDEQYQALKRDEDRALPGERWLPCPGYEEFYAVSDLGRVMRTAPGKRTYVGRILRSHPAKAGYIRVGLSIGLGGQPLTERVHRLVALAFLSAPPDGHEVNHINGDKNDNAVTNLEWVTKSENLRHAYRLGLKSRPGTRLTEMAVRVIKRLRGQVATKELASLFGVRDYTISSVLTGRSWRGVGAF